MSAILTTVLPVFGLILLGYGLARVRVIDGEAGRGITLFVFNVAIPALLFRTVASLGQQQAAPWALWIAYFGGLAIAWLVAALVARHITSLNHSGGAAASMATGFGNLAMLGTPLALSHFGEAIAVPLGMILSVHAPILWTAATLHRGLARHATTPSFMALLRQLAVMLTRNAIIIGLAAGTLWRLTGIGLHPVPDRMLAMLADASVPTALVALGVSLSAYTLRGAWGGMLALIALKMLLMPLAVFLLCRFAVALPRQWTEVAVLFAAMPTGANAFLFAQKNNEAVAAVSGAVAAGTALAALTTTVLLYLMDSGVI
ncbi:MAG: AEC family transporter [Hyphomicrobiales bacterium]